MICFKIKYAKRLKKRIPNGSSEQNRIAVIKKNLAGTSSHRVEIVMSKRVMEELRFEKWNVDKASSCAERGYDTRFCMCAVYIHQHFPSILFNLDIRSIGATLTLQNSFLPTPFFNFLLVSSESFDQNPEFLFSSSTLLNLN